MEQFSPSTALARDGCQRVDARRRRGGLIEKAQRPREIQIGICGDQARHAGNRFRRQDGAGAGVLHLGRVLGVGEEGELARPGVLHAGHPGDVDVPRALQTAPQPFGNLRQFHDDRENNFQRTVGGGCGAGFSLPRRHSCRRLFTTPLAAAGSRRESGARRRR